MLIESFFSLGKNPGKASQDSGFPKLVYKHHPGKVPGNFWLVLFHTCWFDQEQVFITRSPEYIEFRASESCFTIIIFYSPVASRQVCLIVLDNSQSRFNL